MIFKFKYNKYKYSKSTNKESKLKKLTNKYEEVFLKILNKEDLSPSEGKLFMEGFSDIKKYIVSSLLMNIDKPYESKKPIEKKLYTLYNQYKFLYPEFQDFMFRIREELDVICEDSIYSSIGLGDKSFNKQDKESSLILFTNNMFFFNVLNFLEKNVNSLKNEKIILTNSMEDIDMEEEKILKSIEIENLLKEKNILNSMGQDMYNEIKEVLISEDGIPDHLIEIIRYLKE